LNCFQKLIIENFQSHHYTEIDFSDGLNVFVGPSDSGKSAILRALRWVLFNIPRGSEFIRTGAKECRVSLIFADGTEVIRLRSSSVNRYILRKPDGTEQIFEGFGNTVPQEVTDVHRIQPVKLDQKEMLVHFGTQLESPFLLFESSQTKAKTIGRISGAHLIDNALKKTNGDRLALNSEIRRLEEEREKLEEKLKPYGNLDQLESDLETAEEAFYQARRKQELLETLRKHVHALQTIESSKQKEKETIAKLKNLSLAEAAVARLEQKIILARQWTRQQEKWLRVQREIGENRQLIQAADRLPLAEEALRSSEAKKQTGMRLIQLKSKWDNLREQRSHWEKEQKRLEQVPEAGRSYEAAREKMSRLKTLMQLGAKVKSLQKEIGFLRGRVSEQQRRARGLGTVLPPLESKSELLRKLKTFHRNLTDVRDRISRGKQYIHDQEQTIIRLTNEWAELLKQQGTCPTCGSPISGSIIEHIMNEYQGGYARAAAGRENQADSHATGEGQK
jgi:DNA repair protein SbcC/Rad50